MPRIPSLPTANKPQRLERTPLKAKSASAISSRSRALAKDSSKASSELASAVACDTVGATG
jgi:hypothetical protein